MNPIIRKRKIEDSTELTYSIAVVWNTMYKGIVDDDFLKCLLDHQKEYVGNTYLFEL